LQNYQENDTKKHTSDWWNIYGFFVRSISASSEVFENKKNYEKIMKKKTFEVKIFFYSC
jgi:hypothetical protein